MFKEKDRIRIKYSNTNARVLSVTDGYLWVLRDGYTDPITCKESGVELIPPEPKPEPLDGEVVINIGVGGQVTTAYCPPNKSLDSDCTIEQIPLPKWRRLKAREAAEAKGWFIERVSNGHCWVYGVVDISQVRHGSPYKTPTEAIDEMIQLAGTGGGG